MSMLGKPINRSEPIELVRARRGIYITLGTLSFILNFLFLVAMKKSWRTMKKRRVAYHIVNLAVSDAIVGAATTLSFIIGENSVGNVFVIIVWTAVLSSLSAVSLMAVERTLAIKLPHRWSEIFPLRKVFVVMFLIWLTTMVLAILMHFFDLVMRFILLILFYVPIMITSFLYFYIYFQLWIRGENEVTGASQTPNEKKKRLYQRKVGTFVLLLTAILVFTVSPSFLCLAVKNGCEISKSGCDFTDTVTHLSYYFYMLEITNFVINPIIYVWKISMFRRAVFRLVERDTQTSELSYET